MLSVGDEIWVQCEVKPGPFSDERRVVVPSEGGRWVGLVPSQRLAEPDQPRSMVRCDVLEIQGDIFVAKIPGHAFVGSHFVGRLEQVTPVDGPRQSLSGVGGKQPPARNGRGHAGEMILSQPDTREAQEATR